MTIRSWKLETTRPAACASIVVMENDHAHVLLPRANNMWYAMHTDETRACALKLQCEASVACVEQCQTGSIYRLKQPARRIYGSNACIQTCAYLSTFLAYPLKRSLHMPVFYTFDKRPQYSTVFCWHLIADPHTCSSDKNMHKKPVL